MSLISADLGIIIVNALCTGIGTGSGIAIGTYIANKTLISNIDKILEKVEKQRSENKN